MTISPCIVVCTPERNHLSVNCAAIGFLVASISRVYCADIKLKQMRYHHYIVFAFDGTFANVCV